MLQGKLSDVGLAYSAQKSIVLCCNPWYTALSCHSQIMLCCPCESSGNSESELSEAETVVGTHGVGAASLLDRLKCPARLDFSRNQNTEKSVLAIIGKN